MGLSRKATPQEQEAKARKERIADRLANPKASPTNKDIMDALNDLIEELKQSH
jgi:hypothetical protein